MEDHVEKMYALKKQFIDRVKELGGITINGIDNIPLEETAPHIISVLFGITRSEVLLHALAAKGIYVSSGSACSSNHPELSGTLKAAGVKDSCLIQH